MHVRDAQMKACPVMGLDEQGVPALCRVDRCMGWRWSLPEDQSSEDGYCELISFPPELTLGPDKD